LEETIALLERFPAAMETQFEATASKVMQTSGASFLQLAKASFDQSGEAAKADLAHRHEAIGAMVAPLQDALMKLEAARAKDNGSVTQLMLLMKDTQEALKSETSNLVPALRRPEVRGSWGELQLRRTVELAGMVEHCDFDLQETIEVEDGRLRPDMIVRL